MDTSEFDIEFLAQKLSENPQSPLFARLADLYLQKEQHSEALQLCEEGIKQFPKYYAGYLVLGKICLSLKEYATARDAFAHALELSPFNEVVAKLLASVPNQPDDSIRTTDKTYFVSQHDADMVRDQIAKQFAQQAAQELAIMESPTEEEMGFSHSVEETTLNTLEPSVSSQQNVLQEAPPPASQPADQFLKESKEILSSVPSAPSFPSFDEYYAQHISHTQGGAVSTLDEYLAGSSSALQEEAAPSLPQEIKEPMKEPSVDAQLPFEQHKEPEPVFTSPEQAQLFAEMMGETDELLEKQKPAAEQKTDIDDIAQRLQNVERIVPQEQAKTPAKEEPTSEPEPEPETEMVTPTLAEIYASQGEYGAAIQAYEILMFTHPGKTAEYQQRIRELQKKQMEKEGLL